MTKILSGKEMPGHIVRNSILSFLSRAMGFLIPFVMAVWFGHNKQTDAFFLALVLITFFQNALTALYEMAVVPFIAEIRHQQKPVGIYLGNILTISTVVLIGVVGLLLVVLQFFLKYFSGLPHDSTHFVSLLVIEFTPMIFFVAWTSALNGALNAYQHFNITAISPAIRSILVVVFALVLKDHFHLHSLAIGFVVGEFIRFLISYYAVSRYVGRIHFSLRPAILGELSPFFRNLMPQLVGVLAISAIAVVDQVMASWLGEGAVSSYAYAERLYTVPYLLLANGVMPVIFSHWANEFSRQENKLEWKKVQKILLILTALPTGLAMPLFIFHQPAAQLIYGWGKFPQESAQVVASLFAIMIVGLPLQGLNFMGIRLLMIYRKMNHYMALGISRLVLDIVFNVLCIQIFGFWGIAVSSLLMNFVFGIIMFFTVRKMVLSSHGS